MSALRQQEFAPPNSFSIRASGREFFFSLDEMIELLAAIRDTPRWGNSSAFLNARELSKTIMESFQMDSEY